MAAEEERRVGGATRGAGVTESPRGRGGLCLFLHGCFLRVCSRAWHTAGSHRALQAECD